MPTRQSATRSSRQGRGAESRSRSEATPRRSSRSSQFSRPTTSSTGRRATGTWDNDRDYGYSAGYSNSNIEDDLERSRRSPARRSYASIEAEDNREFRSRSGRVGPDSRRARFDDYDDELDMDRDRRRSAGRVRYEEDDDFGEIDHDYRRFRPSERNEGYRFDDQDDEDFDGGRSYNARTRSNDLDEESDEEESRRAGPRDWNEYDEPRESLRGSRASQRRPSSYGRGRSYQGHRS